MFEAKLYNFVDAAHFNEMRGIIVSISRMDASFPFYEFNNEMLIMLFRGDSKDDLHRRLTWLLKKADRNKSLIYDVFEKHESLA